MIPFGRDARQQTIDECVAEKKHQEREANISCYSSFIQGNNVHKMSKIYTSLLQIV